MLNTDSRRDYGRGSGLGEDSVRRYWAVIGVTLGLLVALFVVTEAAGVRLLSDPDPWLRRGGIAPAVVGVALLVVDAILPVPSSLVMVALGARYGLVPGAVLSLLGGTGSTLVGFLIGRRGGPLLLRSASPVERDRADRFLRRWGSLAVVVSRPVPLLAEATAIVAGTSSLGWGPVAVAAVAGSVPGALLYAGAGSLGARSASSFVVFAGVVLIAGALWLVSRRLDAQRAS